MGQHKFCFDLEHAEESNLTKENEWEPMDWEIREWYTELEIAIRVNELSIETRFGGLERRLEELQIASKLRRNQNIEIKRGSIDRINNLWDDESSSDSEESNCSKM